MIIYSCQVDMLLLFLDDYIFVSSKYLLLLLDDYIFLSSRYVTISR